MFDKDQLEKCLDIATIPTLLKSVIDDQVINDRDKSRLILKLQTLMLDIADGITVGNGDGYSGVELAQHLIEKYKVA